MQWQAICNFGVYLAISLPLLGLGAYLFMLTTPYKEFSLIGQGAESEHQNKVAQAAAYDLGGKIVGQAMVLASAIYHSVNISELLLWGVMGIVVQVLVFYLYEFITPFKVLEEIPKGNISVGVLSSRISFAIGLLMAALIS